MKRLIIIFAATVLGACGNAGPLDGLEPGEEGRVVRILDGDTLALSTGQVVKLASLEAPSFGYGEEEDDVFANESARILKDLAMGRRVRLAYPGMTRDKYDRAIAHVETVDDLGATYWINREVARRGGARVRVYADTSALADELLSTKADGRLERAGLWGKRAYNPEDIAPEFRGFTLIEGVSIGTSSAGGQYAVCRLSLEGTDLLLEITEAAKPHCNLQSGTALRARGYMREGRMEITHTLNLTVLDQSS